LDIRRNSLRINAAVIENVGRRFSDSPVVEMIDSRREREMGSNGCEIVRQIHTMNVNYPFGLVSRSPMELGRDIRQVLMWPILGLGVGVEFSPILGTIVSCST
jgi:hypothetical protein